MLHKCTAESFFRRAEFLHTVCEKMLGSPHYTPYTVLIPWVEQCITKRVCVVNLWSSQPGCACGPGADDFPVLLWGITLTGQWRDAEWCTNKRLEEEKQGGGDCTLVALKWPNLWVTVNFLRAKKAKALVFFNHYGYFSSLFIKQCCHPWHRFVIERASFYQWLRFWLLMLQCKMCIFGLVQHFLNFKPFSHPCHVCKFIANDFLHVLVHIEQIMTHHSIIKTQKGELKCHWLSLISTWYKTNFISMHPCESYILTVLIQGKLFKSKALTYGNNVLFSYDMEINGN